jgi:hypothetical protein
MMTENVNSILEQLENGEIDALSATRKISHRQNTFLVMDGPCLQVSTERILGRARRVNVKTSLRLLAMGMARYLPELNNMDWNQIMDDFIAPGDGSILEVVNHREGERVTLSIETG